MYVCGKYLQVQEREAIINLIFKQGETIYVKESKVKVEADVYNIKNRIIIIVRYKEYSFNHYWVVGKVLGAARSLGWYLRVHGLTYL